MERRVVIGVDETSESWDALLKHLTSHGHDGSVQGTGRTTDGLTNTSSHDSHKKPSLMDKINPKVDADGDGKAGFMK